MKKDNYHKEDVSKEKKPLPIGISDYIRAQAEYYYVDKTLLIKEFLDQKSLVSLFTRPRRFGKTLNMDMLRVFFEKSTANTSVYFADKEIWKCGEKYTNHSAKNQKIYSLLLVTGYLKVLKKELQADGSYLCEVSIPNKEIAAVYKNEILSHLL